MEARKIRCIFSAILLMRKNVPWTFSSLPGHGQCSGSKAFPSSLLLSCLLIVGNVSCNLPSTASHAPMRFRTQVVVDNSGIGIEAFRLLVPSRWKCSGKIRWVLDDPGMPATASLLASDSMDIADMEFLPNQSCFRTDNPNIKSNQHWQRMDKK